MKSRHQQHGVALVIGLILLVVMTLLGVSATSTALMEERMAGNMRDYEMALHAGETGLRDAEIWIDGLGDEPSVLNDCEVLPCVWGKNSMDPTTNEKNWWQDVDKDWWDENAVDHTTATLAGVASNPLTVIEENQYVDDDSDPTTPEGVTFYRVTAKGTGGSDQARVLLQSTWARRY